VGRGAGGKWEGEEVRQDTGPPCRRGVQPGSVLDFLSTTDVGQAGSGRGRREERSIGMGAQGAQGAGRGEEGLGAGEEPPLFLPTPSFMATAEEGWGTGSDFLCSFLYTFPL